MQARIEAERPLHAARLDTDISTDALALLAEARNAVFAEVQAGRLGQGISMLEQAMAREPMSFDLLSDMAALLLSAGQLESAAAFAQQALALQPQHGVSLYSLGFAMAGLGELEQAQAAFTRILVEGPAHQSLLAEAPDLLPLVRTELARILEA